MVARITFILQIDPVLLMEKAAVRHACALDDDLHIVKVPRHVVENADEPPCPVGSVDFCTRWMRHCRIPEPEPIDYPDCLRFALGRHVRLVPFDQARIGSWIKPRETKAWEPHIMTWGEQIFPDDLVWECEQIPSEKWIAEWRVYVLQGRIVGHGRYDDGPDESVAYDAPLVQTWVDTYTASGTAPEGYALDVALLADGRTIMIEVTDGWAIGYYKGTCSPVDYARLLAARWHEIAAQSQSCFTKLGIDDGECLYL